VLLVVLSLLVLFAAVALSFVFFSEQEGVTSKVNLDAQDYNRPDPDLLMSFVLNQVVYDTTSLTSALRTHGLVTNLYGEAGTLPFSGAGRRHVADPLFPPPTAPATAPSRDAYYYPNFINGRPFAGATYGSFNPPYTYPDQNHLFLANYGADGIVRSRSFVRPGPAGVYPAPYAGVNFDPYFPIDPAAPTNLALTMKRYRAWWSNSNPTMVTGTLGAVPLPTLAAIPANMRRAMVMRPGGWDHPNFPPPEDLGGDVKNLPPDFHTLVATLPGPIPIYANNDSYWIDLGFPVQRSPDGKLYRPLFALFIADLDSRVNLNYHGNTRANLPFAPDPRPDRVVLFDRWNNASNQGWGPWEVNLGRVLMANLPNDQNHPPAAFDLINGAAAPPGNLPLPEWPNLFAGRITGPTATAGRYGLTDNANALNVNLRRPPPWPGGPASLALGFNLGLHPYAMADYDGALAGSFPAPVGLRPLQTRNPIGVPPGRVNVANPALPPFPAGYDNGLAALERTQHPAVYAGTAAANAGDRRFHPALLEAVLRHNDTGTDALATDLLRLLPVNFGVNQSPLPNPGPYAGYLTHNADRTRRLVTTTSGDVFRPGAAPW
jgi:hypothetical protein